MRGGVVLIRLSIFGLRLVWGNEDCPAWFVLRVRRMEFYQKCSFLHLHGVLGWFRGLLLVGGIALESE